MENLLTGEGDLLSGEGDRLAGSGDGDFLFSSGEDFLFSGGDGDLSGDWDFETITFSGVLDRDLELDELDDEL